MTDIPIAERILDAFPSGSYSLLALLRLLDIVETAEVDTAAVECTSMPRLLISPHAIVRRTSRSIAMPFGASLAIAGSRSFRNPKAFALARIKQHRCQPDIALACT